MQFILLGFDQRAGIRRFVFQGIADRTRADFAVKVDLGLSRRYGIRLQELPLLCRELLERHGEGGEERAFTFGEAEMGAYATTCALKHEAAARKKKVPRKSSTSQIGSAWRAPQP